MLAIYDTSPTRGNYSIDVPFSEGRKPSLHKHHNFSTVTKGGRLNQGGRGRGIKICPRMTVFQNFEQNFDKFQSPSLEPPKTIAGTNLGLGVFF